MKDYLKCFAVVIIFHLIKFSKFLNTIDPNLAANRKKLIDFFYCVYLHALRDMNNKFTIALITIDYWVRIPQFTNKWVFPADMIVESNSAFTLNLAHHFFQKRYRIHIHGTFSHFKSPKTPHFPGLLNSEIHGIMELKESIWVILSNYCSV